MNEQTLSSFSSDNQHCQSARADMFTMVTQLLSDPEAPRFSCDIAGAYSAGNGAILVSQRDNGYLFRKLHQQIEHA